MQRVRIGLTGLAFVFVLVLLGAVFRSASNEEPITANSVERQLTQGSAGSNGMLTQSSDNPATEPLAELGVAPGNPDSNETESSSAAQ